MPSFLLIKGGIYRDPKTLQSLLVKYTLKPSWCLPDVSDPGLSNCVLLIWTSDLPSPSAPARERVWKPRQRLCGRLRIREVADPPSIYWMAPRPIVRKRHMFISASGVSPEQLLNSQPPPPSGPLKGRKRSALRHISLCPHARKGLPTGNFLSSPLSASLGAGKRGATSTQLWSTKATLFLWGADGRGG